MDESRSNLYYLYAHLAVWLACIVTIAASCIVAEMREYDDFQKLTDLPDDKAASLGFDHENGVWTNAAGWYCAVGGQSPDNIICGKGRNHAKED